MASSFDPRALKTKPAPEGGGGGGGGPGEGGATSSSAGGGDGQGSSSSPLAVFPFGDSEDSELSMVKLIVLAAALIVTNLVGMAAMIFFLGPVMLQPVVDKIAAAAPGHGEEGEQHGGEHGKKDAHGEKKDEHGKEGHGGHGDTSAIANLGLNFGLEDFTVNLTPNPRTPSENQFLRAKLSLSIKVPEEENCIIKKMEAEHAPAEGGGGGHGGGHGGGAPAPEGEDPCMKSFKEKMGTFLPNVRDVINSSLMRRTANALGSVEGQEMLKDEIIEQVNTLLHPVNYSVLRVNFEEFIVQR
jgi:flagellar basal body-associated protein FliL